MKLDADEEHAVHDPESGRDACQGGRGLDAGPLSEEGRQHVDSDEDEMEAAENEDDHPRPHLPDPEHGFEVRAEAQRLRGQRASLRAQIAGDVAHAATLAQLGRDLAARQDCVSQEERRDREDRGLRDVQIL